MNTLNNLSIITKLDQQRVAESLTMFPEQLISGWQTINTIKFPSNYKNKSEIIFCGMGGSNLASEMLRDIYGIEITEPIILVRNYNLPTFASKNSLIIIASYSGNTEETLNCFKQANKIQAKIIVITSGGKLLTMAQKHKLPAIKLDTKLNPSRQPRYGLGLQLGAIMGILTNLKKIKLDEKQIKKVYQRAQIINTELLPVIETKKNVAKQLSLALKEKTIFLFSSEHLKSNAHILANQINESAKQLAIPFYIPELNHHLLEAFSHPQQIIKESILVSLTSNLYNTKIKKRFSATGKIFHHLKIKHLILESLANNRLDSAIEILIYGNWISFYLAMINNKNPASIPWVQSFKKELKS